VLVAVGRGVQPCAQGSQVVERRQRGFVRVAVVVALVGILSLALSRVAVVLGVLAMVRTLSLVLVVVGVDVSCGTPLCTRAGPGPAARTVTTLRLA
jgi:hypothetical protein